MSTQFFHLSPTESLAGCVANAMADLARRTAVSPVLIVDSPFAVQPIKQAMASADWPGRGLGAPLPWCGSLEQGFETLVSGTVSGTVPDTFPRSLMVRSVQLAQQLLDHPGLSSSLGGSAKAALDLAVQWVALFEGWEWLQADSSLHSLQNPQAQISADIETLRSLHKQNQQANDRALWAAAHAPNRALHGQQEVWFCMGRTPSDREIAMAKTLWGAGQSQFRVFALEPIEHMPAPVTPRQLIAARSVEQAAWSAAQVILQWRKQGLTDLGVVPLDRKVVRRLRALLDRAGEPFTDRSGWALDTTVAATAVTGLSDLLANRATTQSFLEWLHSPFVARALQHRFVFGAQQRQSLDAVLRGFGRIAPVKIDLLLKESLLPAPLHALQNLACDQRLALAQWAERLLLALDLCGLQEALAEDAAGQALLAALQVFLAESANENQDVSAAMWQAALAGLLSQSRFAEQPSKAAVQVCSLGSLLWRAPQAVLVIGAEAARLPEQTVPRFFEPKRLAEMGLQAAPEQIQAESFAEFVSAWAGQPPMCFIASSEKPDAEVEFSGWIELLALHAQGRIERIDASNFITTHALTPEEFSCEIALQAKFEGVLPQSLSVSSLQSLTSCAYQFYLQTLRGFAPIDTLQEEAAPSDLGSLLHLVLRGADEVKSSESEWQAWLEKEIDRLLATPFFQKNSDRKLRLPMPAALRASLRAEAMAVVPGLAQWLARHGPSGLAVTAVTEEPVSRILAPFGITIKGRIDRIEKTENGLRLIDFKTTDPKELKRRIKAIEDDVQLALYAWLLSPQPVESAAYVSIRREGVEEVGVSCSGDESLSQRVEQTIERLAEKLALIVSGAPIQAEGIHKDKKICEQCPVRGICRRDDLVAFEADSEEGE